MVCSICPRKCGVDRSTDLGFCGAGEFPRVALSMLHRWEEPFISGTNGSGTVFFSGCNLRCVYCQNQDISRDGAIGEPANAEKLAQIYLSLQNQGAHNVNLVTAAPHVPIVAESIRVARENGLSVPIVYNTSGYESVKTLRLLDGLVDIYLPDFKYVSPILSKRFSAAEDYFEVAVGAIGEMTRQVGALLLDENNMAQRGVSIRHLILPGCVDDSRRVLDAIKTRFGCGTYISLMSQYTPNNDVTFPLNRRLTKREYERIISYALSIGLYNILIQEKSSANACFTPTFT